MSFFIELLRSIWDFIKKIFVKILNFVLNIVNFFKNPQILNKLKQNRDLIAISIKENLGNGNYNVLNCVFDKERQEVVYMKEDAMGITAESLDKETEKAFGNKDMLILK